MGAKGTVDVAKKRGRPVNTSRDESATRRIILLVTPEYDEWLEKRAVQLRTTKSGAMDRMMAEWAAANEVEAPPARL